MNNRTHDNTACERHAADAADDVNKHSTSIRHEAIAPSRAAVSRLLRWVAAAGAAALVACSSLPTVGPELAQPRGALRIEAANGKLLTARQSQAVIEKLKQAGKGTELLERHLALEEAVADAPLSVGNSARLLQDGPATYAAMLAAIRGARDHVNMETYILDDDAAGRSFADALIERQRAGVQVNLIHDGIGTLSTPKAFFTRLTDAGVKVLEFNPINPLDAKTGWNPNQRDHRKILIVDGATGFLGGINISGVYSGGSAHHRTDQTPDGSGLPPLPWRDTDLQLQGPVVAELQKLFIGTWQRQKGEPLAPRDYFPTPTAKGNSVVRAIGSDPDEPFSLIYATFISAINSAESEVLLTNAYFVPDPQLTTSLIAAAQRGVDVKVIVPSTSDSWLVFRAGRSHYEELLRGGVKLYERREVLLHAKTAIIDGVWSTVGSANLDWRSFLHNQEVNAVILGVDFGARMREAFEKDLAASEPITLERWHQRPAAVRMKEMIGRMWEYWL